MITLYKEAGHQQILKLLNKKRKADSFQMKGTQVFKKKGEFVFQLDAKLDQDPVTNSANLANIHV